MAGADSRSRPNVLVIMADDHAQWASGCYGNREIRSPTIDWLAERGVRMANAMTVTPVCSPARACFWTGRYPSQHGMHDYLGSGAYRDPPWLEGEVFLGEILAQAGYRCGFFGKWHCGMPETPRSGFEDWFCIGRRTGPHAGLQRYDHNGSVHEEWGYQTDTTTRAALRFLETDDPDRRPFFAFVGPVATHSPYEHHPERLVDAYRLSTFEDIPAGEHYDAGSLAGEGRYARQPDRRELQAQYYAAVSEIDESVGRLVDSLEQRGELENTLIVYTSDHGLNAGHHGLFGKGNATRPLNMLEESIRIPMIFSGWRGLASGQVRAEFMDHTDLFQTLCELAGATPPGDRVFPGRSAVAMLVGGGAPPSWKEFQAGEYGDLRMIRSRTHKLIRRHGRGNDELYDLDRDPREQDNVLERAENAGIVQILDQALEQAFACAADSPQSGLRVAELRSHNEVEAWRETQGVESV
ncbi:MAG: hypothetical protein EA383_11555 [Spirochaetaceae bacterium]|nr:MAG: hypothetical protein EA383_11555 [Spirochaetaceae bacterium]